MQITLDLAKLSRPTLQRLATLLDSEVDAMIAVGDKRDAEQLALQLKAVHNELFRR